jgi:hypothetical protein
LKWSRNNALLLPHFFLDLRDGDRPGRFSRQQVAPAAHRAVPDMVRQNKARPQSPGEFFADGRSSRARPEGTVEHSQPYEINGELMLSTAGRFILMKTRRSTPGGSRGRRISLIPIRWKSRGNCWIAGRSVTDLLPALPRPGGDGKGITGKYGMISMADFHDERLVRWGTAKFSTP